MTIGILLDPYGENAPGGMGRAVFLLVQAMIENDQCNDYVVFIKNKPKNLLTFKGTNWRIKVLDTKYLWFTGNFKIEKGLDLYVFFTPVIPLFFKPKKSIVFALDFAYVQMPSNNLKESFDKKVLAFVHGRAFKKSSLIISISKETESLLKKYFKVPDSKSEVVYIGYSKIPVDNQKEIKIPLPFFLFAGVLKARKNVLNIVKAFGEFVDSNPESKTNLVIAGKSKGEYFEKLCNLIKELNIENRVIFAGYVTEPELAYLYAHAQALVFPSLIEGFGMPVLEAMDCGLPVITSNRGALSEVAGVAALLVDPDNPHDIAEAMKKMSGDTSLRNKLIALGLERAKEFSWEKAAKEIVKLAQVL